MSELHGNQFIGLPDAYTEKTPCHKTKHPKPQWPFQVAIPQIGKTQQRGWHWLVGWHWCTGINGTTAEQPRRGSIKDQEGSYVVNTLLGWVVSGPLTGGKEKGDSNHLISANRIWLVNQREILEDDKCKFHQATATHLERDIVYGKPYLRPLMVSQALHLYC